MKARDTHLNANASLPEVAARVFFFFLFCGFEDPTTEQPIRTCLTKEKKKGVIEVLLLIFATCFL